MMSSELELGRRWERANQDTEVLSTKFTLVIFQDR